ncbi:MULTISPECIES: hypothetical protein [unclassified Xanthobacter]|nr:MULTISPECIES: hypothetical protein [unclassified Xanthobacter]
MPADIRSTVKALEPTEGQGNPGAEAERAHREPMPGVFEAAA